MEHSFETQSVEVNPGEEREQEAKEKGEEC